MTLDLDQLQTVGRNALHRVSQGQIVSDNGTLRHPDDVLSPEVITALHVLHRHGFIALAHLSAPARWPVAELTLRGMQLLDWWNRQPAAGEPNTVPASTSQQSGVSASTGTVTEVVTRGPQS